ncbi:MAG TPA: hypothetical protein VM510_17535, partial [Caulifigura sp.]|nr:hypothetical protein [Caulifigura sp.]
MTSRRPFQRLIAALAIASGSAAYGATAQPSPLQPIDSFQTPGLTRNAILAGDSVGAPILLAADRGGKGGGGGGGSSRSSGGGGGSSARSSGG